MGIKKALPRKIVKKVATKKTVNRYVIVRTYSAGCFAGYLKSRKGQEVVLAKARRLWYWDGAATLSQLAQSGTSKPQNCKFPEAVDLIELTQAIEIIDVTPAAKASIDGVKLWVS